MRVGLQPPTPFPLNLGDHANRALSLLPHALTAASFTGLQLVGARGWKRRVGEWCVAWWLLLSGGVGGGGGVRWRQKTLINIGGVHRRGGSAEAAVTSSGSWPWDPFCRPRQIFQLPNLVLALLIELWQQPWFPAASGTAEPRPALPEMVSLPAAEFSGGLWGLSPDSGASQGSARLSPQAQLSSAC